MPRELGQAARREDERGEPRGRRVPHLSRPGCDRGCDDLVARREDRDAWPGVNRDLDDSERREEREIGGPQAPAPLRDDVVHAHVLVRGHDAFSGGHRPHHLDRALHRECGVLDHHDPVGAVRQRPAGGDGDRAARLHPQLRELPHRHGPVELEVGRQPLRRAERVGCADGVAVDGRAREARQWRRRAQLAREDAAVRVDDRNPLDCRAPRWTEPCERLGDAADREEVASHGEGYPTADDPFRARRSCMRSTLATGPSATWPRPQIEVSRSVSSSSPISPGTSAAEPPRARWSLRICVRFLGADATGHALAAALVAEEAQHVGGGGQQIGALGADDEGAGAEHRACVVQRLEVERRVEDLDAREVRRGAARLHGRERAARR